MPSAMVGEDAIYSSFEQITEDQIAKQKVQELKRIKSIKDQTLLQKMRALSIDYKATKLYFKFLKESYNNTEQNQEVILSMTELIRH